MKKLVSYFLIISFALSFSAFAKEPSLNSSAPNNETAEYTIFEPYQFPVVPETPEWLALQDNIAKIEACAVPDEVVTQMSTAALLETYLTHPLATNIFACDSYDAGFALLKDHYEVGLDELLQREDLCESIVAAYSNVPVFTEYKETRSTEQYLETYAEEIEDKRSMQLIEVLAAQIKLNDTDDAHVALQDALYEKYSEKAVNSDFYERTVTNYYDVVAEKNGVESRSYPYYVTTPRGTQVYSQFIEDQDEWKPEALAASEAEYKRLYPYTVKISPATFKYNCHSYAWYSQSPNRIQVGNVWLYMEDGSYRQVISPSVESKIYYGNTDEPYSHSGIVKSTSGARPYVWSKWSEGPVYAHYYDDCFWYVKGGNTHVSYWNIA